ncbi:MAG: hypothetical protein ACOYU3_01690 [Bacillota bacterium]
MAENTNRLGYLMEMLDISGKELAQALTVDATTVSKWKNNQRKLTYKSKYTRKIAGYFLNSAMQSKRGKITALLTAYMPELNIGSEHQLVDALCLWLTEKGTEPPVMVGSTSVNRFAPENGYVANVRVYTGYKGIMEALATFWEYTLTLPYGQEILLADYRDINFDEQDPSDIVRMMKFFIDAAEYGHTIKIIDCATDVFRPYVAIFRWLPMYLSENVQVWRYQDFMKRETRMSTFVLPGEIVLSSFAVDTLPGVHHSMIFHDRDTVRFMEDSVRAILANSKKMIETIKAADVLRMLEILDGHLKSRQLTYMLNPVPTFRNMPIRLLREILEENGVEEGIISICLEANRRTRAVRDRCRYIQIYDLDAMEARVHSDFIVDYDLSAICGKRITVPKACYKRHLEYLLGIKSSENYSMTMTSFSALGLLSTTISIIVQDDSLVVAWDPERYPRRMYCMDLQVINGFYTYIEDLWKAIPPICKDDGWKCKQLNRMIQMLT